MREGLLSEKIGMTQLFQEGKVIPVTVVKAGPCVVVGLREVNGEKRAQLGFLETKGHRLARPQKLELEKKKVSHFKVIKEFGASQDWKVGDAIGAEFFQAGEKLDVRAKSIGRGFQGVMRRFGYKGGPASHGSMTHRKLQSAGDTNPNRVHKGKGMPGRMGAAWVSVKNLEVVTVDREHQLIALKGAVPGKRGGLVFLWKK